MDVGRVMAKSPLFNEDYYEHGVTKKLSGYENYHYMPTRSYEEAITFSTIVQGKTLDYGCAKGFLVHCLRQIGVDAWGEDISEYCLTHCHPRVAQFLSKPTNSPYDTIICKDVMEHVDENDAGEVLRYLMGRCHLGIFVIPLGDNDKFRIREYELDSTHVTKKDEDWWIDHFRDLGYGVKLAYSLGDVKKKWQPVDNRGNGFFFVTNPSRIPSTVFDAQP